VGLIEFCSETLEFSKQKMGRNHPLTGDCYNRLEELYYQQHLNVPARQCFDNAINIYSINPGSGSLAIAKVFSNLGGLKMNLSEYDSAEVFLQMALDIQLDLLDTLDPNLLPTYNKIGALYYYLGNLD
jgi:tetratricopeptide (TPR) repeat protein